MADGRARGTGVCEEQFCAGWRGVDGTSTRDVEEDRDASGATRSSGAGARCCVAVCMRNGSGVEDRSAGIQRWRVARGSSGCALAFAVKRYVAAISLDAERVLGTEGDAH